MISKTKQKDYLIELETNIENINNTIASDDYLTLLEICNAFLLSYVNNPKYGDLNRKALGFSLQEIIYKCEFNKIKCSANDFEWYDFSGFLIFRLKSGKISLKSLV